MSEQLTPQQEAVVLHPPGKHARVLAVAGSGKTTTMVHRVKYLVQEQRVDPQQICVLMFNRRARVQFAEKLEAALPAAQRPAVNTFHSYAYKLIQDAGAKGLLAFIQDVWVDDKEEQVRRHVHLAIENLTRSGTIAPDSVDPDDVIESISLWKGSLIPPERAGHLSNPLLPRVYAEFEQLRLAKNAITYDDFIPLAVGILEAEPGVSSTVIDRYGHVIVDEYQDVNYGQQRLIELIAGQRADIMVVGDDDQTIYEWRGARPSYIVSEFANVFHKKPTIDYQLSHTFRFGPVIAQCAQHVIAFNQIRIQKPVIAHYDHKPANIYVSYDTSEQPTDVNQELAGQVISLVRETRKPKEIVVLARMFSQLTGLEAEFLKQKIPYRVIGRAPFFERREIVVLLDYLRLSRVLDNRLDQNALNWLLSVANVPNRKLSRELLTKTAQQMGETRKTLHQTLSFLAEDRNTPLKQQQRERVSDLLAVLERLNERITDETSLGAGELLGWLAKRLDYWQHFDHYYGMGESSEDRKRSVKAFCEYAERTGKAVVDFLGHLQALDTTRGVPEEQQIVMTTVFRVKGEEFDYVFIPDCEEGYMPCLIGSGNPIFDKKGMVAQPPTSDAIENERRLFYVAITRARKAVFIGTSAPPRQGQQANSSTPLPSRFLEEMQLQATVAVMGALQRAASGDREAASTLGAVIKQHSGYQAMMHNLLNEYLPRRRAVVPEAVKARILSQPAVPFVYQLTYRSVEKVSGAPQQVAEDSGWDDEFEDEFPEAPKPVLYPLDPFPDFDPALYADYDDYNDAIAARIAYNEHILPELLSSYQDNDDLYGDWSGDNYFGVDPEYFSDYWDDL